MTDLKFPLLHKHTFKDAVIYGGYGKFCLLRKYWRCNMLLTYSCYEQEVEIYEWKRMKCLSSITTKNPQIPPNSKTEKYEYNKCVDHSGE